MLRSLALLFLFLLFLTTVVAFRHNDEESSENNETEEQASSTTSLYLKFLMLAKLKCLIVIFVGTFFAGVSPYFFKWDEGFLVLGTQFSGGVFLGTAFTHFLAEANETFKELIERKYPYAYMIACIGYLLTMFADSIVFHVCSKQDDDDIEYLGHCDVENEKMSQIGGITTLQTQLHFQQSHESYSNNNHCTSNLAASVTRVKSFEGNVLLIIVLCFHSIFEGIAIGVAETIFDAWKALWTITLHKIFAAIAMGIALIRMIPNRSLISCSVHAFAFAISSPFGVGIGLILDAIAQGHVVDWIFAISMALASGIFIYVSINHLLIKGYTPLDKNNFSVNKSHYKFLAVLFGIGVIDVVMIWDN
ncbi:hypothetical protein G4B88_016569 [Cannabis sativa]|uniref:Uncharacterized protein n=1 Tax=Cannabis sativa TaxID=3483 RepID=A0A7J6H9W1_CANSA|nr:hypothetical protein G4B88_016569 [Cannabis sativa]